MNYIKRENVDWSKTRISQIKVSLNKYDMYYVQIALKNGVKRRIRVFTTKNDIPDFRSEEFNKFKKTYGKKIWSFFVDALLGSNSLIVEEKRDDYIYLGHFDKNENPNNRLLIEANGKTAQENFDNDLFRIKMQVQAKEQERQKNKGNSDKKGKHYAMSDIHGMYGSYMEAINRLGENDHIFILGDVIDRGENGIKIIQDIMRRYKNPQNNPKITFLLGNHEIMFLQTVNIMFRYGMDKSDIVELVENREKPVEFFNNIKSKGISPNEFDFINNWINENQGDKTIFKYLDDVNPEEKEEMYDFLLNLYLILPQEIEGKDFLFVHAMPINDMTKLDEMKRARKGLKVTDLTTEEIGFILCERENETYAQAQSFGFTTICGHTPEQGSIVDMKNNGYVRIDAACGQRKTTSKLALYCIEDHTVEYIDEKPEFNFDQPR